MPCKRTIQYWLKKGQLAVRTSNFTDFLHQYVISHKIQWEYLCDEVLAIADDARGDYIEKADSRGNRYRVFDPENVAKDRLRIQIRLRLMSIQKPTKYDYNY